MVTKKQLRIDLLNEILEEGDVEVILQKRPQTGIRVVFAYKDKIFVGIGFSKVRYPDKWDENYGVVLAKEKAAADIVKQILKPIYEKTLS